MIRGFGRAQNLLWGDILTSSPKFETRNLKPETPWCKKRQGGAKSMQEAITCITQLKARRSQVTHKLFGLGGQITCLFSLGAAPAAQMRGVSIQHLAFSIRHSAFGVWDSGFEIQVLACRFRE